MNTYYRRENKDILGEEKVKHIQGKELPEYVLLIIKHS